MNISVVLHLKYGSAESLWMLWMVIGADLHGIASFWSMIYLIKIIDVYWYKNGFQYIWLAYSFNSSQICSKNVS